MNIDKAVIITDEFWDTVQFCGGFKPTFGEYEKHVLTAVCSIVEARGGYDANGFFEENPVVYVTEIFKTMYDGADRPSQDQRDQIMDALRSLMFTPVVVRPDGKYVVGQYSISAVKCDIEGRYASMKMISATLMYEHDESSTWDERIKIYAIPAPVLAEETR